MGPENIRGFQDQCRSADFYAKRCTTKNRYGAWQVASLTIYAGYSHLSPTPSPLVLHLLNWTALSSTPFSPYSLSFIMLWANQFAASIIFLGAVAAANSVRVPANDTSITYVS